MKLFRCFFTCFILSLNSVYAQQIPYFISIIDSDEETQFGIATVALNDGNILIGGTRRHPFSNKTGLTFIRTDAKGIKQSEKNITFFDRNLYCTHLFKQSENTLITLANVYDPQSNDGNWMIFNTDTQATIFWSKQYGETNRSESMSAIVSTNDGGYLVYGYISDSAGIGNNEYLVRLDSLGNMLWKKEYESPLNTVGMSLVSDEQGNYILSADKQTPGNFYNIRLKKVNGNGTILWEKDIESEYNGGCKSIIRTSASEYIVVGESVSPKDAVFDIYLIKLNTDGDVLQKAYNGTRGNAEAGFSIYEYTPNEFIIAGYSDSKTDSKKYAFCMRIDSGLNELGRKYYGDSLVNFFNHIRPHHSNGFIAVGNTSFEKDHFFLVHDGYEGINGISSTSFQESIIVFPNPVNTASQSIQLKSDFIKEAIYEIRSIRGELIEKGSVRIPGIIFPDYKLSEGLYLLYLKSHEHLSTYKIIVE